MKRNFLSQNLLIRLLSFLCLASLPFFWFGGNEIIYGPDSLWQLNYEKVFLDTITLWKDGVSFGYGWSDVNSIIHTILVLLFEPLGISYSTIQKIIISLTILISAAGMYFLFLEIIDEQSNKTKVYATFCAILYVVNPFALSWVWWRFLWVIYIYPVWPIAFLVLIRIIRGRTSYREIMLFSLLLVLFSPGIGALLMSFIILISLFLFALAYLALKGIKKSETKNLFSKLVFLGSILFLLNTWWLLPGVLMIKSSISNALTAYDPTLALKYTSVNSNVSNVMTLWGNRALYDTFYEEGYYGEAISSVLTSPTFPFLKLLPVILLVILLLTVYKEKNRRIRVIIISLFSVYIVGVFLSKGLNDPFKELNLALLELPLIGPAFRIPYDKFGYMVAFTLSLLLPLGLRNVFNYKSNFFISYLYLSLFSLYLMFLINIVFSQNFLPADQNKLKGVLASVPKEYTDLKNLELNSRDKVLILPPGNSSESSYTWKVGVQPNGKDIIGSYLDSKIIFLPNGNNYSDTILKEINNELFTIENNTEEILATLNWLGINYIFIHKDWNAGFMNEKVFPPSYYLDFIDKFNNVEIVENNSYFTLYKINSIDTSKFRYLTKNIVETNRPSINSYIKILPFVGQDVTLINLNNGPVNIRTIDEDNIIEITASSTKFTVGGFNLANSDFLIQQGKETNVIKAGVGEHTFGDREVSMGYQYWPLTSEADKKIVVQNLETPPNVITMDENIDNIERWKTEDWECYAKHSENIKFPNDGTVRLLSKKDNAICYMLVLGEYATTSTALIKLDYFSEKGANPKILVLEDGLNKEAKIVFKKELTNFDEQTPLVVGFRAEKGRNYRLFFFSERSQQDGLSFSFGKLKMSSVPPDIFKKLIVSSFLPNIDLENRDATKIVSTKINSTRYQISMSNVKNSGYLYFGEAYDQGWRIRGLLNIKTTHVVLNGYANGWYLDMNEFCIDNTLCAKNSDGSYDIELIIEFNPQRWFYLGLIISGTTLVGCLGYLLYDVVRRRRENKVIAKGNN